MIDFFVKEVTPPSSFGIFYISIVALIIILCIYTPKFFKTKSLVLFHNFVTWVWLFLVVEEIARLIHEQLIRSGNWLNVFSFHLCSMPLYFIPLYLFSKNPRVKQASIDFVATFCLFGAAISFFEPSGLLHEYQFATFHSLVWHGAIVILSITFVTLDLAINKKSNFKEILVVYGIVIIIATVFNILLKDISDINLFFISPFKPSSIIVFKEISLTIGFIPNAILFTTLLAMVVYGMFILIRKTKSNEKSSILID